MSAYKMLSKETAALLDQSDPLKSYRSQFVIEEPGMIYMDGNSLGRLAIRSIEKVNKTVQEEWGKDLIRSWGKEWYPSPQRAGDKIAQLAGAAPGEVIVCDSTSINLFKLVIAALQRQTGRKKIISDDMNFPSDLYILQGCIDLMNEGHYIELIPSVDTISADTQKLIDSIDEDTALVTLSHVTFKSGYLYDAAAITQHAHEAGALVLWDLSHSIGAVPIKLDEWVVDMAVGCTYKYLNGGPGSPAFLYVREALQPQVRSPIWGWFGQKAPFAFDLQYSPADGLDRFLCGTPPMLSLLAMEASIELTIEAGKDAIRQKSEKMTAYLLDLFEHKLAKHGFSLGTPRDPNLRGSHISLRHRDGYRINRALIEEMNVIPDFREPDNIRLGLSPLYTTYSEIFETVDRMESVLDKKLYLKYSNIRQAVT